VKYRQCHKDKKPGLKYARSGKRRCDGNKCKRTAGLRIVGEYVYCEFHIDAPDTVKPPKNKRKPKNNKKPKQRAIALKCCVPDCNLPAYFEMVRQIFAEPEEQTKGKHESSEKREVNDGVMDEEIKDIDKEAHMKRKKDVSKGQDLCWADIVKSRNDPEGGKRVERCKYEATKVDYVDTKIKEVAIEKHSWVDVVKNNPSSSPPPPVTSRAKPSVLKEVIDRYCEKHYLGERCNHERCYTVTDLEYKYRALWCPDHLNMITQIRDKIDHSGSQDEIQARLQELKIRRDRDKPHIKYYLNQYISTIGISKEIPNLRSGISKHSKITE
jgi:hypothetical protein